MSTTHDYIEHAHLVPDDKTIFGFWLYLMSDCLLFASLFATYAVMRTNTFGGPGGAELFSLPFVLLETIILLTSSFTCGLTVLSLYRNKKGAVLGGLATTFLLGSIFVGLELSEFARMIAEGNSFTQSGFLSAFFTLVGTHGLHVSLGLIWMFILGIQIIRTGLVPTTARRLVLLSLFWHFLDIVWIFIFTFVYLMAKLI